jgi:hypothetical protein
MTLARRLRPSFVGLVVAIAIAASAHPASAGSFDFLFGMEHVHNDTQYFLNLAVSHSDAPRQVLEPLLPRVRSVEPDLPVLLYLHAASGWPLPQLVDLRARGASWSVIFTHVGVPQAVLFEGMPENPGPPYGNAWGYWKKNPRGARLRDNDVCDLVRIQMASRMVGVSQVDLARGYAHGMTAPIFVAEKHGRPYRNDGGANASSQANPGNHGHGHGAGQGAGHGNPHGKPKSH